MSDATRDAFLNTLLTVAREVSPRLTWGGRSLYGEDRPDMVFELLATSDAWPLGAIEAGSGHLNTCFARTFWCYQRVRNEALKEERLPAFRVYFLKALPGLLAEGGIDPATGEIIGDIMPSDDDADWRDSATWPWMDAYDDEEART